MADPTTLIIGAAAVVVTLGGNLWAVAYTSGKTRSELATIGGKVEELSKSDLAKADGLTTLRTQMSGWERQQERHEELDNRRELETKAALREVVKGLEDLKETVLKAFSPLQTLQTTPKDVQSLDLRLAALETKTAQIGEHVTATDVRVSAQAEEIKSLREWRHAIANVVNVDVLRAAAQAERDRGKQT